MDSNERYDILATLSTEELSYVRVATAILHGQAKNDRVHQLHSLWRELSDLLSQSTDAWADTSRRLRVNQLDYVAQINTSKVG